MFVGAECELSLFVGQALAPRGPRRFGRDLWVSAEPPPEVALTQGAGSPEETLMRYLSIASHICRCTATSEG